MSVEDQVTLDPARTRVPARGVLVAAGSGIALLVLVAAFVRWWTSPSTFDEGGYGFTLDDQTPATMESFTADMTARTPDDRRETITLRDVTPLGLTNSAGARITFAVCEFDGNLSLVSPGSADRVCTTVAPVTRGQQVRLGAQTTITMTVTPRKPGLVVVRGMQVDYSRGAAHLWQRGSQSFGPVIKVRVREE